MKSPAFDISSDACQQYTSFAGFLSFYLHSLADYHGEKIATGLQASIWNEHVTSGRCVSSRFRPILGLDILYRIMARRASCSPRQVRICVYYESNWVIDFFLVSSSYLPHIKQIPLRIKSIWAWARTGTTTTSPGFFPWSKRLAGSIQIFPNPNFLTAGNLYSFDRWNPRPRIPPNHWTWWIYGSRCQANSRAWISCHQRGEGSQCPDNLWDGCEPPRCFVLVEILQVQRKSKGLPQQSYVG